MVLFPPPAGAGPPSPRRLPSGSPVVPRWSWDGVDPLLRANRIRSAPIHFSREARETAGALARQLGLFHPPAAVGESFGLSTRHRGMNIGHQAHR